MAASDTARTFACTIQLYTLGIHSLLGHSLRQKTWAFFKETPKGSTDEESEHLDFSVLKRRPLERADSDGGRQGDETCREEDSIHIRFKKISSQEKTCSLHFGARKASIAGPRHQRRAMIDARVR